MNRKDTALLRKLRACEDARKWCKTVPDLEMAWETCKRLDWMLWALNRIGYKNNKALRLYACACVRGTPLVDGRTVWDLLTDPRSREAVEVAERYANGQATYKELAAAWYAAFDAAPNVTSDATRAIAWAAWAVRDADWAAAGDAALATRAAASAAAWDADRDAAGDAAGAWQADKLREFVVWEDVKKAMEANNEA